MADAYVIYRLPRETQAQTMAAHCSSCMQNAARLVSRRVGEQH